MQKLLRDSLNDCQNNEYSQVARYKIDTQKSSLFPYPRAVFSMVPVMNYHKTCGLGQTHRNKYIIVTSCLPEVNGGLSGPSVPDVSRAALFFLGENHFLSLKKSYELPVFLGSWPLPYTIPTSASIPTSSALPLGAGGRSGSNYQWLWGFFFAFLGDEMLST